MTPGRKSNSASSHTYDGSGIVTQILPWVVGPKRAKEILLTGNDRIPAVEAHALGMVNRVVPEGELIPAAEALAAEILANPPLAVRANVRVMRWFVNEMQRQSRYYTQGLGLHLSEDFQESARAFVEKRPAVFKGR